MSGSMAPNVQNGSYALSSGMSHAEPRFLVCSDQTPFLNKRQNSDIFFFAILPFLLHSSLCSKHVHTSCFNSQSFPLKCHAKTCPPRAPSLPNFLTSSRLPVFAVILSLTCALLFKVFPYWANESVLRWLWLLMKLNVSLSPDRMPWNVLNVHFRFTKSNVLS